MPMDFDLLVDLCLIATRSKDISIRGNNVEIYLFIRVGREYCLEFTPTHHFAIATEAFLPSRGILGIKENILRVDTLDYVLVLNRVVFNVNCHDIVTG